MQVFKIFYNKIEKNVAKNNLLIYNPIIVRKKKERGRGIWKKIKKKTQNKQR